MSLVTHINKKDGNQSQLANFSPLTGGISNEIMEELQLVINSYANKPEYRIRGKDESLRLPDEVVDKILTGLALRFSNAEIAKMINEGRQDVIKLTTQQINYFRKKYEDVIDELYAVAIIRIGELYRLSDKLARIASLNRIGLALEGQVLKDLESNINDSGIKKATLYLKVLAQMDKEVGGRSLKDMVRAKPNQEEDDDSIPLSKDEIKSVITDVINTKYSDQLPGNTTAVIDFANYHNCAFVEHFGDNCVCWNKKISGDKHGGKCKVQTGELTKCPKFLNKSLLDNKEWLTEARNRKLSIRDLSVLVGCSAYDNEIYNCIVRYLHIHEIPFHGKTESGKVEQDAVLEDSSLIEVENVINVDEEDNSTTT